MMTLLGEHIIRRARQIERIGQHHRLVEAIADVGGLGVLLDPGDIGAQLPGDGERLRLADLAARGHGFRRKSQYFAPSWSRVAAATLAASTEFGPRTGNSLRITLRSGLSFISLARSSVARLQ